MTFPLFNVKFILLISASFVAIFSSIAIYFCLPLLISHVIRTQITLSPTSGSYNNWRLNSVIDRMYLYNITNLGDLVAASGEPATSTNGLSRLVPEFQQVGPFTFRQDREKINIKFDPSNETVLYEQKRKWTFLPELSLVKSVEELNSLWINHISVPLAGTTLNAEYGEFIDPIVQENDLRLFLNHSANTLLFEGYFDILMEQAKASGQLDVDRFGWMHDQNNSISKPIRVFTGPSNATLDKFGSVDQMDHKRQFNIWRNTGSSPNDFSNVSCNEFRYSSAGEFFPPPEYSLISHNYYYNRNLQHQQEADADGVSKRQASLSTTPSTVTMKSDSSLIEAESSTVNERGDDGASKLDRRDRKAGKSISLFIPDLCRTIKLFYNGSYYYRELLVDRYVANEFTYVYSTEDDTKLADNARKLVDSNKCYCVYNENTRTTSCPPNGLMDLFNCRKGSPISISFPHFLYSTEDKSLAPNLKQFGDNVKANKSEHEFFIDLESTLNVPVNVQIVYQFNVHLRNEQSMNFTKEYAYLFEDPSATTSDNRQPLKDLYLPQMWIKSTAQIDDTNLRSLIFIQKHLNLVTPITTIIIFVIASILLMASAKLAYDLTYGPGTGGRKSISCDHESCSSLNGNHECSYLAQKKKYFSLHLLDNEKSQHLNSAANTSAASYESGGELAQPSTSNKANNFVITTSSLCKARAADVESQPLNR